MRSIAVELESEIRGLWRYAPLTTKTIESGAPELIWAVGHGSTEATLSVLRELVLDKFTEDRHVGALAVALLFDPAFTDGRLRQRLSDYAAHFGNEGWRSAHRWASLGATKLARRIAELEHPSILVESTIIFTNGRFLTVTVTPPHRFTNHQPSFPHDYDYRLRQFSVLLDGLRVDLPGEFVDLGERLIVDRIPFTDRYARIDFMWIGDLGFGVTTSGLSSDMEYSVTAYPDRCLVVIDAGLQE